MCEAEEWPSLPADPARAHRILTNPGVTAYVAVAAKQVVGFVYLVVKYRRGGGDGAAVGPAEPSADAAGR